MDKSIPPVNPELAQLLKLAKTHVMTPEEKYEQRISWAYGNLAIEDESVTKEQVRKTAEELYG